MPEQFLIIASHIRHTTEIAVCGLLISVAIIAFAVFVKKSLITQILQIVLAIVITAVAIFPLLASRHVQARGVYSVYLVVLNPDNTLADYAQVKASTGGALKMVDGGWQLDVPFASRPAGGKVTFSATVKDEFLKGQTTVDLGQDYFPKATIQLVAETVADIRGVVVDGNMVAVEGATVSMEGDPEVAITDQKGKFVLRANAARGQMVELHAKKGQIANKISAPAGKVVEIVLSNE